MEKIEDIRRARLRLLQQEVGSQAELYRITGIAPSQLSQWANGSPDSKTGKRREMSTSSARRLEMSTGKPEGWMDQPIPTSPHSHAATDTAAAIAAQPKWGPGTNVMELSEKLPLIPERLFSNTFKHAPVVAWACLGDDLRKPNEDWPVEAMRVIYSTKPMSGLVKWIEVQDDLLAPRVIKGDFVVVDPDGEPKMDSLVLARAADGTHMLRFYRPLAGGAFEVFDGAGRIMDSERHGVIVEAAFVTLQRDSV